MIAVTFFNVLKVAGLLVALASSAIATIMNLKDAQGALTRWGKINFGAILFGGFLAISAQLLDNASKQEEALLSLKEIQRILHPITRFKAGFSVRLDNTTPVAQDFLKSVQRVLDSIKDNPCVKTQFCFPDKGIIVYNNFLNSPKGSPSIYVDGHSALIPPGHDLQSNDLNERALMLLFYRSGGFVPNPNSHDLNWLTGNAKPPDLRLNIYAKIKNDDSFTLHVDLNTQEINQVATSVDVLIWSQTGEISSIQDFSQSNIVIQGANLLGGKLDLNCVKLEVQQGRSLWIGRERMQVLPGSDAYTDPLFFVRMPADLAQLDRSCL